MFQFKVQRLFYILELPPVFEMVRLRIAEPSPGTPAASGPVAAEGSGPISTSPASPPATAPTPPMNVPSSAQQPADQTPTTGHPPRNVIIPEKNLGSGSEGEETCSHYSSQVNEFKMIALLP